MEYNPCLLPRKQGSVVNIQNYFRRVKDYTYGYLLGHQAGLKLEKLVKKFSKNFKSHRRVAESD